MDYWWFDQPWPAGVSTSISNDKQEELAKKPAEPAKPEKDKEKKSSTT